MSEHIKELKNSLEIVERVIKCMQENSRIEHYDCLMELDDVVVKIREIQLALLVAMV